MSTTLVCASAYGTFAVASSSKPGVEHLVHLDPREETWCTCSAWKYSKDSPKTCKHIRKVVPKVCDWREDAPRATAHPLTPVSMAPENVAIEGSCPNCGGPLVLAGEGASASGTLLSHGSPDYDDMAARAGSWMDGSPWIAVSGVRTNAQGESYTASVVVADILRGVGQDLRVAWASPSGAKPEGDERKVLTQEIIAALQAADADRANLLARAASAARAVDVDQALSDALDEWLAQKVRDLGGIGSETSGIVVAEVGRVLANCLASAGIA